MEHAAQAQMIANKLDTQMQTGHPDAKQKASSQHITQHLRWINFGSIGSLPTRTKPESPTPWTTFDAAIQTHLCLNMHCIVLCRHGIMINFNLVWSIFGDRSMNQPPDRCCHGTTQNYNRARSTLCLKPVTLSVNQSSLSSTISTWPKPGTAPLTMLYPPKHPRLPVGTPLWTCGTH